MSVYKLIGIWRCSYRGRCGLDPELGIEHEDQENTEKVCLTRRHRDCELFKARREESRKEQGRFEYYGYFR